MLYEKPIVIAGGGIAGLTAALALAQQKFKVLVLEKASKFQEVGAGVQLSPNATCILENIGILKQCKQKGVVPDNILMIDGHNFSTLTKLPIRKYTTDNNLSDYITIHRADLHCILHEASIDNHNISIKMNCQNISYEKKGVNNYLVKFNDTTLESSMVIAADGIWSKLRKGNEANFSGNVAWRTTIDKKDFAHLFPTLTSANVYAILGSDNHIIIYPISDNKLYNIIAVTNGSTDMAKYDSKETRAFLSKSFTKWSANIQQVLQTIPNWTIWPLFYMPYTKLANEDKIIFIGDAAHGFLPYAAQGACMAIEDAGELADISPKILSGDSAALNRFIANRHSRIEKVRKRGDFNSFVFHASGVTRVSRNIALKIIAPNMLLKRLDWLYNFR